MSEWDSDIASLLDDVLQDKPEAAPEPAPETPTTPQEQESLSCEPEPSEANESASELGTATEVSETPVVGDAKNVTEVGNTTSESTDVTLESLLADDTPDDTPVTNDEVTTVVSAEVDDSSDVKEDVAKAKLPEIEFSTPVDDENVATPSFTDEELMDSIDVRNFATLVSLTNRRWHAKKKDRKAAQDAADATGADKESYEARKRLLVGADEKLKAVHKHIDAARTDHYRMTLPWSTVGINDIGKRAGARLLPNSMVFEYAQVMGKHKVEMQSALDDFVSAYPTLIALAQQKLQGSFDQTDYPPPSAISDYFGLEFDFEPIPSGGDFQGLQDAQVEKLSAALRKKTQRRLENAMQDAWVRLYDTVVRAVNSLTNPDAMFHYTLVDALREHSSMLKHLNVINDAKIEEIRAEVEKQLTKHDAKDVRKDDALRKRLGEAATAIKAKMEEYANG